MKWTIKVQPTIYNKVNNNSTAIIYFI